MAEEKNKSGKKNIPLFGKNPPNAPFKNVIDYLDALAKTGTTGSFDDLTKAVKSTSIGSSTFIIRTNIMKGFGLIRMEKISKSYTIEPIGVQITDGATLEQKQEAIRKAFLNNTTIRKIWETFHGNIIPPRESFGNNLTNRLPDDIPNELREKWANYFYDGAEFVGFFDKRPNGNYLKADEPKPEQILDQQPLRREGTGKESFVQSFIPLNEDMMDLSKKLSTGRMFTLTVPEYPTPEEANEIMKKLEATKLSMEGFARKTKDNGQSE